MRNAQVGQGGWVDPSGSSGCTGSVKEKHVRRLRRKKTSQISLTWTAILTDWKLECGTSFPIVSCLNIRIACTGKRVWEKTKRLGNEACIGIPALNMPRQGTKPLCSIESRARFSCGHDEPSAMLLPIWTAGSGLPRPPGLGAYVLFPTRGCQNVLAVRYAHACS